MNDWNDLDFLHYFRTIHYFQFIIFKSCKYVYVLLEETAEFLIVTSLGCKKDTSLFHLVLRRWTYENRRTNDRFSTKDKRNEWRVLVNLIVVFALWLSSLVYRLLG